MLNKALKARSKSKYVLLNIYELNVCLDPDKEFYNILNKK